MKPETALCSSAILALLAGCGGGGGGSSTPAQPAITGFTAASALVAQGSPATLTAVFSGGAGTITPGVGAVTSGVPVATGPLDADTTFTLTVASAPWPPATRTLKVAAVAPPRIAGFASTGPATLNGLAYLEASFTGGTALVTPGSLAIASGVPLVVGPMAQAQDYLLTVTNALGATATSGVSVAVGAQPAAFDLAVSGLPAAGTAQVRLMAEGGSLGSAAGTQAFPGLASGMAFAAAAGIWDPVRGLYQAQGPGPQPLASGATAQASIAYAGAPSLRFALPDAANPGATVDLVLAQVPAGTFLMGSPEGEKGSHLDEQPAHAVTLSRPYYAGEFPVTQAQWRAVMGANPSEFSQEGSGSATDDFTRPVECVSWTDVVQAGTGFLDRLNAATAASRPPGTAFRLPTEAEWEWACRAGTATRYYWGDDPSCAGLPLYGWFSLNAGATTHAVGSLGPASANPFGLFDLAGNVWEWCRDWYGPYAAGAATDPQGPASGTYRVVRGGSWYEGPVECRSASRGYSGPGDRFSSIGLRVVLAAD